MVIKSAEMNRMGQVTVDKKKKVKKKQEGITRILMKGPGSGPLRTNLPILLNFWESVKLEPSLFIGILLWLDLRSIKHSKLNLLVYISLKYRSN